MKYSKSITLAVFMALCGTVPIFGQAEKYLMLHHYDGRQTAVKLSENPVVRVEQDQLVVQHGSNLLQEPISEIKSFNVEESDTPVSVGTTEADRMNLVWLDATTVMVTGAKSVALYSVDGLYLGQFQGDATIHLNDYAAKVFIIKANEKTFKITVKQ